MISPANWAREAGDAVRSDGAAALVTVAHAAGSAPREAGARMLVTRALSTGTIGGGNLEFIAIEQARRLLDDPRRFLQQDYPLGPLIGQCCGGRVCLLIERLDAASLAWLDTAAALEAAGRGYRLVREIAGEAMTHACERDGKPGAVTLEGAGAPRRWTRMEEIIAPRAQALLLFGAGHVGRAVARTLHGLPFALDWIDSRAELAGWPEAALRHAADPAACVAAAPAGAYYAVMTHSHDLDYRLVAAVLARGDAAYCGLIGSAAKRARFLSRLAGDGIADSGPRLTCPIGAIGVRSKAPAAIAIGVAAELMLALERAPAPVGAGA